MIFRDFPFGFLLLLVDLVLSIPPRFIGGEKNQSIFLSVAQISWNLGDDFFLMKVY